MKRVFVDSGGFFALLTAEDRFHDHARSLFSRANAERWRLVTTNAVVVETYSLLLVRSRGSRRSGLAFLDMVGDDAYHVERVRKRDEERAIALLRAHEEVVLALRRLEFRRHGTAARQGGDRVRQALPGLRSLHHLVGD